MDPLLEQLSQFLNEKVNPMVAVFKEASSPYMEQALNHINDFKVWSKSSSNEYLGFEMPKYRQNGWTPSEIPYTEMLIIFTLLITLWEFYLELRQHGRLYIKEIPHTLVEAVDNLDKEIAENEKKGDKKKKATDENENSGENKTEKKTMGEKIRESFETSREYNLDKSTFELVTQIISLVETILTLAFGYLPFLWDKASLIADKYDMGIEGTDKREIYVSLIFLGLQIIVDDIIHMPLSLYSIFVIEARHGFNKQTLGLYFSDKIKGLLLSAIIGAPVIAAVVKIIKWGGEYFYIYLWSFMFVFTLFMTTIYPVVIAPLFNKYTPLDEDHADLKKKIDILADSVKFPLTKIYTMDGSKRSNHSNAFFYGFFKNKRIVLFDTLLTQVTHSELVAILGHELGHWKMGHTIQMLVIGQIHLFLSFFAFGFVLSQVDLYLAFGFSETPTLIGLFLFFSTIWAPIEKLLGFLMTLLTRHNEFEADAFAHKLNHGQPLQSGLVKLQIENKSNMNPDPLFSAYHFLIHLW